MKNDHRVVTAAAVVILSLVAGCSKPPEESQAGMKLAAGQKFDPDPALRLPEALAQMIADKSFAAYEASDLYSDNPGEGSQPFQLSGTAAGGTPCTASLVIRPAKTSGRLKKKNLKGNYGYVIGRVDNTTANCTANGLYSVLGPGGSGAIVAREVPQDRTRYEARLARLPGSQDTAVMSFTFCGHNKPGENDKAERAVYSGPDACAAVQSIPRAANARTSGGEVFSPAMPPQGPFDEIAWLGCSDDCCPASQPPDTSRVGLRPNSRTTVPTQLGTAGRRVESPFAARGQTQPREVSPVSSTRE